jgi:hypothetical protein
MSQTEYDAMLKTGMVQESYSGTTHVLFPGHQASFARQALPGSVYVEFNVPTESVKATQAQTGWAKILGPNTIEGRLAAKKGQPIPQMPKATNITKITSK